MKSYLYIDKDTNKVKYIIETYLPYDVNSNMNDSVYCVISNEMFDMINYDFYFENNSFRAVKKEVI